MVMRKTKSMAFAFIGKEDSNYRHPILGEATIRVSTDMLVGEYGAEYLFNSLSQATRYRAYKRANVKPCEVHEIIFL